MRTGGAGSAPLAPSEWALPQGGEGKASGAATKMQLFGAVAVPGGLGLLLLLLPPSRAGFILTRRSRSYPLTNISPSCSSPKSTCGHRYRCYLT